MILSLVIPVYNTEKYLNRCLDSIYNQDVESHLFEVVLVIDGSPDNSAEIAESYAKKHRNFLIVYQTNQGLSEARNSGILKANGKFIWFIDSDDSITPNSINAIIKLVTHVDCEILTFGFKNILNSSNEINYYLSSNRDEGFYNVDELVSNHISFRPMAWTYVYSIDFIRLNNLCFHKGIYHEDEEFSVKSLCLSSKNYFVNQVFYEYYQNHNSIMTSFKSKSLFDLIEVLYEIDKIKDEYNYRFILFRSYILVRIILDPKNLGKISSEDKDKIFGMIKRLNVKFADLPQKSISDWFIIGLLYINPRLFVFFKRIYNYFNA